VLALIEARGAIVSKDALMARIWPDRIVEENNLQSHIVALRKAFGPDRDLIRTVPGRGYQFTGDFAVPPASAEGRPGASAVGMEAKSAVPKTNLPAPVSDLIGRDEEISEIVNLVTGLGSCQRDVPNSPGQWSPTCGQSHRADNRIILIFAAYQQSRASRA
jgi:hypothetical protein